MNENDKPIMAYKCDPDRNKTCPRDRCYLNGGPCQSTFDKDHALRDYAGRIVVQEFILSKEESDGRADQ